MNAKVVLSQSHDTCALDIILLKIDTLSSLCFAAEIRILSDPQLLHIFSSVSGKTKLWQEMTGRLLQTKTATLFREGSLDILNVNPR